MQMAGGHLLLLVFVVGVQPGVRVIFGPLLGGSALRGRVSKSRNCRHGRGNGCSEFGHIGRILVGLLAASRTDTMFLFTGFLSCQCLAFSADENLVYTSSG